MLTKILMDSTQNWTGQFFMVLAYSAREPWNRIVLETNTSDFI